MTFKQKIKHFFYYYKWHVIITIFAVIVLGLILKSCTASKEPDINISYISDKEVSSEAYDMLFEKLQKNNLIADINNDDEPIFYFDPIVVDFETSSQDYEVYEKLQLQLSVGTQTLIFAHRYALEDFEWAFDDVSKYANENHKTFTNSEGTIIGISVEGNKFLESVGINTENLYASIHIKTSEQKESNILEAEYEHAYKILEFVLENQ